MTQPASPFPVTLAQIEVPQGTFGPDNPFYFPIMRSSLPPYVTPLDFTTVVGVTLSITRLYDLSTAVWTATSLLSVTVAGLVAVYVSPTANDTMTLGLYEIRPRLLLATGGQKPASLTYLSVVSP